MPRERHTLRDGVLQPFPLHLDKGVQQTGGRGGETLRTFAGTETVEEAGESEGLGRERGDGVAGSYPPGDGCGGRGLDRMHLVIFYHRLSELSREH